VVIGSRQQSVFPMNVVAGKHAPCSCRYNNLADSAGPRVALVAGYTKELNANPFHGPMTSLPLFIYNAVHVLGTPDYVERGFGAGFVLVVVVLALFTIARRVGGSAPGEITKRQRRRLAREAAL
jgi:hypothetical protein